MIGSAAKLATLPLRRRLIGAGIMLVGVLFVLLGFFVNLTDGPVHGSISIPSGSAGAIQIPLGSYTGAGILQHAFDHSLFTSNTVRELGDAAVRGAVVAMAAAGALALLATVISPLRGLAGTAAGAGLGGVAAISGVLFGENSRITADFSHAPQFHVDLGMGLWILAAGFALILVGAALAAWRPLAGLFSGIGLAVTGAGLGASLAFVTGSNHLLGH
ncbi:MAG TPA: hypothetical protein VGQ42_15950 [Candidatus Dormibacteraeota bacterium]|jgi:hypothetical protein|nr:hypothetical protein [Candidatus Dormibacteraeota bacterium]